MRFAVRFLRRRGRVLPSREVANQAPRFGDLRIEECLDEELHRYVRTAKLFDVGRVLPDRTLPELLDVLPAKRATKQNVVFEVNMIHQFRLEICQSNIQRLPSRACICGRNEIRGQRAHLL